jgi:hypothetical protein
LKWVALQAVLQKLYDLLLLYFLIYLKEKLPTASQSGGVREHLCGPSVMHTAKPADSLALGKRWSRLYLMPEKPVIPYLCRMGGLGGSVPRELPDTPGRKELRAQFLFSEI